MSDYADKKKEELVDEARNRGLSGYSDKNKDELVALLEESDASQNQDGQDVPQNSGTAESSPPDSNQEDVGQKYLEEEKDRIEEYEDDTTDPDFEVQTAHHSEASNLENPEVVGNLSPEGQEAAEQMSGVERAEADAALDASGPLHLQSPDEREMTGALTEKHGEEQRERVQMPEDGHTGGFSESGVPLNVPPDFSQVGSRKDNLHESDDRELYEVRQEDVIDFPPPLAEREAALRSEGRNPLGLEVSEDEGNRAGDGEQTVEGDSNVVSPSKAVLYTDGLSGDAEMNLERANEIPERLQSTDKNEREAGDVSLSEAAKEDRSSEDDQRNEEVTSDRSQDEKES
jgi:hypothetical protein